MSLISSRSRKLSVFLLLFLLVFPKGGFKIGDLPITWGYVLLGLGGFCYFICNPLTVSRQRLYTLCALLPFLALVVATFLIQGVANTAAALSLLCGFFFLPTVFLFTFSGAIDRLEKPFFILFRRGILFLVIFGLCLFLYRIAIGQFFEIPFLTSNFSDFGTLETKCNNRGGIFKLFSTYNNGNLFGICMNMAMPLYFFLETRGWPRLLFRAALLLTLSRVSWIGLILNELLLLLRPASLRQRWIGIALGSIGIILCLQQFGTGFLFDPHLGGRREQFELWKQTSLFGQAPFEFIYEIAYFSIGYSFGFVGLFLYLLTLTAPLALSYSNAPPSIAPIRSAARKGMIVYWILSCGDGGVLFIPVLAFYWFFASLALRKRELVWELTPRTRATLLENRPIRQYGLEPHANCKKS